MLGIKTVVFYVTGTLKWQGMGMKLLASHSTEAGVLGDVASQCDATLQFDAIAATLQVFGVASSP